MNPVEAVAGGVRVRIRVQPRASRTELAGRLGNAYKLRVASPPVDGAANEEVIHFLARRLGVPRGSVEIISGWSGRNKLARIEGVDVAAATRALDG